MTLTPSHITKEATYQAARINPSMVQSVLEAVQRPVHMKVIVFRIMLSYFKLLTSLEPKTQQQVHLELP